MEENPYEPPRAPPDDAVPSKPLSGIMLFRWIGYFALLILLAMLVVWLFSILAIVVFR